MSSGQTFFFYDLETSGFSARRDRIMQFAGQRTDADLTPIGEPVNLLVKLTDEVLPSPQAIIVTGITPQQTVKEGISEAELARFLHTEVFLPGTIMTGYNSIRFDDEFLRYLNYRNFYDAYEWGYAEERSRWDLLDVIRMTRALRPEGLEWPFDDAGRPNNKLETLAKFNGLIHEQAHDALSDVMALIGLTKLLRQKQPKLFEYLLKIRSKQEVANLVDLARPQPFVYSSGRYPKENHHTTVAFPVAEGAKSGSVLVYNLRQDPAVYIKMTDEELQLCCRPPKELWSDPNRKPFPMKELAFNRCPAVAPLSVLTPAAADRISLTPETALRHLELLKASGLVARLQQAIKTTRTDFPANDDVDAALYDSFIAPSDRPKLAQVRAATAQTITGLSPQFTDKRLPELFFRYKARNFPGALSEAEQARWEDYRLERLAADSPAYAEALVALAETTDARGQQLLAELEMWAQSLAAVA